MGEGITPIFPMNYGYHTKTTIATRKPRADNIRKQKITQITKDNTAASPGRENMILVKFTFNLQHAQFFI